MKMYAIYDRAIEAFGQPIFVKAQGQAIRSFMDECKNPESQFNKHPEDYELYYIGEFDETKGSITNNMNMERVARATDYTTKE